MYKEAFNLLGLRMLTDFSTVELNCKELLLGLNDSKDGPELSAIIDVPARGDCWLLALLAPILGFVVLLMVNEAL